jgi:probable phosphoglycerate mutase
MSGTEILLLRHGQSEGNEGNRFGGQGPTPLTARGRAQAEATAAALAREGLTALWASDLVRAVQTAEPIAAATGLKLQTTPALRERSVGVFTGLTFVEAEERYPEVFSALMRRDPDACPPEGETTHDCILRAGAFFDRVVDGADGGRVLLVSHAFTLNLLLRRALAIAVEAPAAFFRTDNCGLHRLRRTPHGFWNVEALNDRRHLVGAHGVRPAR